MQHRPPRDGRDLDHPRIGQELGEITPHGRRRRFIGRAEIDQQDADLRYAVVGEGRLGNVAHGSA
jgi:hypothetical protein